MVTYTAHAIERMGVRNISEAEVVRIISFGSCHRNKYEQAILRGVLDDGRRVCEVVFAAGNDDLIVTVWIVYPWNM